MRADIVLRSATSRSYRAAAVQGLFDIPVAAEQSVRVTAELPLEGLDWKVGVIVGASGSGKSTIARALWPAELVDASAFTWNGDCILDDFPDMQPDVIGRHLTAVGLGSTPVWLRPHRVLSTGQRFRAELARALAERPDGLVVFDEYTSVVDRTVAMAASAAVAKHVRRGSQQFIAVTCHRDVLAWLEADWVYDTDRGRFALTRECLRRPEIPVRIREGSREAWSLFRGHHYLSGELAGGARVLLAYVELDGDERLAGFIGLLPRLISRGSTKSWLRGHRLVVLPDLQGLGIGNRMVECAAEALWMRERVRYCETSSAPGFLSHRRRRPEMWHLVDGPRMRGPSQSRSRSIRTSAGRLAVTYEYVPEELRAS